MKKKDFITVMIVCLSLLILYGCSSGNSSETSGNSNQENKENSRVIVIGESSPIASNPNQQAITEGQKKAAELLSWKVETLDANLSADKQITDIDTFISKKVNGITIWNLNQGAADAAYKRASDAGIPIIGINSKSDYFTTEILLERGMTCISEQEAANYIKQKSPNAKVLVIGGPPVPTIQFTVECFEKAAESNGLDIVAKQDNLQDTAAGAQPLVENMLTKYPDVNAIWAYNDDSALGAAAVIQASHIEDIMILGNNASPEAIDAIKKGIITATWDMNPTDAGAAAIAVLAMHYKDGMPLSDLPKTVNIPTKMWDESNVDQYVPWLERSVSLNLPASAEK